MASGWVTSIALAVYLGATALAAALTGQPAACLYSLAFWHYYIYALGFGYRQVGLPVLKRDAIVSKSAALGSLASVYLVYPLDYQSITAVTAGFALNAMAASRLGTDRTYYGYEVAGLQSMRVTGFPYSLVAHPMLIGNIIAFGGLLLNEAFRADWWALALTHVALNAGLILMETESPERRRLRIGSRGVMAAALAAAIVLPFVANGSPDRFPGFSGTAISVAIAWLLYRSYTRRAIKESVRA